MDVSENGGMRFRELAERIEQETVMVNADGCTYLWTAEQERPRRSEDLEMTARETAKFLWEARRRRSEMAFNEEFDLLRHFVNDRHDQNSEKFVRGNPAVSSRIFPAVLEAPSRSHIVVAVEMGLLMPHWIVRVSKQKYQVGWWVMRTNKQMKKLLEPQRRAKKMGPTPMTAVDRAAVKLEWNNTEDSIRNPFHEHAELEFFSFVQGYVYGAEALVVEGIEEYQSLIAASSGGAGGRISSARKSQANRANSARGVQSRRVIRDRRRDAIQLIINESGILPVAEFVEALLPDFRVSADTVRKDLREMGQRG